jgi:hypothetical protein
MDYEYPNKPTFQEDPELNTLSENLKRFCEAIKKVPQYIEKTPKLCPFRKKTYFMAGNEKHSWSIVAERAEFMEEEFQPCIEEKCMLYKSSDCTCGRR